MLIDQMSGCVIDLCDAVQDYDSSIALLILCYKGTSSLILVNYLSSVFPPKARKN